jgi:hypothetical protein
VWLLISGSRDRKLEVQTFTTANHRRCRLDGLAKRVDLDAEFPQFREGLRTMTEVLEMLTRLGEAQMREVRAIADYQVARIDLAFATGTLLGYRKLDLGLDAWPEDSSTAPLPAE